MAVAEIGRSVASIPDSEEVLLGSADLRLEIHDASRVEWCIAVPLAEDRSRKYALTITFDIPANVFARHSPWDQLQSWARLDGPDARVEPGGKTTIDSLRRATVSFAHQLARIADGFTRHCRLAAETEARESDVVDGILLWLSAAAAATAEARDRFVAPNVADAPDVARERKLIDEFLSVRLLEMLGTAERALETLASTPHACELEKALIDGEARVADALESEIAHREASGFLRVDSASPAALEEYLERASRLKKHFQEVLFLDSETYQVAERLHHWVAAAAALLASTWALAWQLALANRGSSAGSTVGSGLIILALVGGLVYVGKDRIKEMGRAWISGNVHRFYAQRVARWRAPARRHAQREVVVDARESFDQTVRTLPDPLNPESGAAVATTLVRFSHRGRVAARARIAGDDVRRVKHIFRYDLSPLFARLDDAVKRVPVLDPATHRVRMLDAPRTYRVPVAIRVECDSEAQELNAVLVMNKRGLERFDWTERPRVVSSAGALGV
jgi:uncharacterized membrane protein